MKLKNIVALVLALAVSVCCLGVSASAYSKYVKSGVLWDIPESNYFSSSNLNCDKLAFGTLLRCKVGNDIIECYQPLNAFYTNSQGYVGIVAEKLGLFSHAFNNYEGLYNIGAWTIKCERFDISDGSSSFKVSLLNDGVKAKSLSSSIEGKSLRFGFSLVNYNSKKYIAVYLAQDNRYDLFNVNSNSKWVIIDNLLWYENGDDGSCYDFGSAPNMLGGWLFDPSIGGNTVSTEVDLPGGDSLSDAYMKSKLTCPNCGGHNISYRYSFLQSGVVGVVTWQVGYVFKCRDCNASWRAMFDSDENDKFKDYIATGDDSFTPDQIQEDLTLPAFTSSSDWGVTLPDDSDTAGYLNEVFGALNTYTGAFNSFFSQVFSILPAPVLAVILLGVGLVVVVGIIKSVVG